MLDPQDYGIVGKKVLGDWFDEQNALTPSLRIVFIPRKGSVACCSIHTIRHATTGQIAIRTEAPIEEDEHGRIRALSAFKFTCLRTSEIWVVGSPDDPRISIAKWPVSGIPASTGVTTCYFVKNRPPYIELFRRCFGYAIPEHMLL